LFPIIFLVSALASGGALLTVVSAIFQEGWRERRQVILDLGRIVLGFLLLDALLEFSDILIGTYGRPGAPGGEPGYVASFQLALFGPYWYVFWIGQLAVGLVVPIAILATRLGRDPRLVTLACAAVVVGFIAVRLNIVIPAQSTEEIFGLARAVDDPRYRTDYFPSVFEWLVTFGIGGLGFILIGLGEVFLPLSRGLPAGRQAS
jgi:molybdopterin-containing oxidoreductase family membrane subunit